MLLENAADGRYVATGHLGFLRQGTLLVVPFDLERLEVNGQPVPAVANVAQALNMTDSRHDTAAGQFSVSASGSLVYALGGIAADMRNSLVWVDRAGKAETTGLIQSPLFRSAPFARRPADCLRDPRIGEVRLAL